LPPHERLVYPSWETATTCSGDFNDVYCCIDVRLVFTSVCDDCSVTYPFSHCVTVSDWFRPVVVVTGFDTALAPM